MNPEVVGPVSEEDRPESPAAAKQLDAPSLQSAADIEAAAEAYAVIVSTPTGKYRRRVFLSLHSATAAVRRAQASGQSARMILCKLVPVVSDLDGGWTE